MRPPRERINRCCRHAPLVTAAGQASAKGGAATHGRGDASKESTRILLYVTDASNRYTVERNGGTSNTAPTQASCGRSSPQSVAPCRQWAGTALLRNRRRRRPFVRGRIRSCCARKTTGRNGGGEVRTTSARRDMSLIGRPGAGKSRQCGARARWREHRAEHRRRVSRPDRAYIV